MERMGMEYSRGRAERRVRKLRNEERRWANRNGPVIVTRPPGEPEDTTAAPPPS